MNDKPKPVGDFFTNRMGLFLHWGLYALDGWHEQAQWRRRIPREEYVKLIERWNPARFNPDAWLDLAEEAGMEYVVLTTKHHDGFCLFDTKQTRFNVMNSPYGKDLLAEFSAACHRRNMPLGLYYSVVDWNQPNYPNQGRHHELPPQAGDDPNMGKYMAFLREQVRELCTNYGTIRVFWWDMNVEQTVDPSINALIRQLQPQCVINNRGMDEGDFGTPERDWDDAHARAGQPVEACQSVGMESWGYRENESYYSDRHILRSIDRFMACGANYLLNIGPCADGTIPEKSAAMVRRVGDWYQRVKRSFKNAVPAGKLPHVAGSLVTRNGNCLYLHFPGDLLGEDVLVPPLTERPRRAVLLNTGQELRCANDLVPSRHVEQIGYLRVCGLPVNELANTAVVVELEFDKLPPLTFGAQPLERNDVNEL